MRKSPFVWFVLAVLMAAIPGMIAAQDAKVVIAAAVKAMGIENLRTLQFSGMGSIAGVGQNRNPRTAWPVSRLKAYNRQIDLGAAASQVRLVRVQGGADQTQEQFVTSTSPWSVRFDFWLTPIGFLKGAMENPTSLRSERMDEGQYQVISYSIENKYKMVGYINEQNLVSRVQTWIDNDVLGDMLVDVSYTVYKDFNGVRFPSMIIHKQGGFPVLILNVNDVRANPAVSIQPPTPSAVSASVASVQSETVAEGVYYLKGGTHHSVAIEFSDHIAVVEAPLNEQRSLAIIAEVKRLSPGKPIRYVINTHHHFDHSGGLRTYVNEGATILTHQSNEDFYAKAFATPRTLNPDRLEQSPRKARIEAVSDKKVLTDGSRTVELHLIKDNPHHDGMLMVFMPKEKIVIEVDVYTPSSTNVATAATADANPNTVSLVDSLEKLRLDFERILPLHGPGAASRADLYAAIRKPVPNITQILNPPPPPAAATGQRGQRGAAAGPSDSAMVSLLSGACTGCHSMQRISNKTGDAEAWAETVERMKGKGAELTEEETRALIDYLAKTYK